ncbi:ribonuclease H-like domain-containing protein [Candidatus Uhrbacteria bacterium]|nr:ribonuclease H-like domain-containing protein [Candidatus Uhrbacteria bacterium]
MRQLVIDIETSAPEFDSFDVETQEYLLKRANTPEKIAEVKERLNIFPLTGEIVAIGMVDVATEQGTVYYQAPGRTIAPFTEDGTHYVAGTEAECLQRFWSASADADRIITFNGRAFDAPWLLLRSLVHGIPAARNLMPPRYSTGFHVDLADQLTYYGAVRNFSLDFWCKTLGIPSPKTDISGADVPSIYRAGEYERIARYCIRDVRATRVLFLKWEATIGQW